MTSSVYILGNCSHLVSIVWFNNILSRWFILCFMCLFVVNSLFAGLDWEGTSKSIQVHPLQATETVEFSFTNTGSDPVTILELKPGCGCITGKVDKKEYAPGEAGVVQVCFDMEKRQGAQRKGVAVKTSDAPDKPVTLYVSTTIPKTYMTPVKRLTWANGEERYAKIFCINNAHKDPFKLVKSIPAREGVTVELKLIKEGYEYELIVTPSPDLKNVIIPIEIIPECPVGVDKVKTFTVYALLK